MLGLRLPKLWVGRHKAGPKELLRAEAVILHKMVLLVDRESRARLGIRDGEVDDHAWSIQRCRGGLFGSQTC